MLAIIASKADYFVGMRDRSQKFYGLQWDVKISFLGDFSQIRQALVASFEDFFDGFGGIGALPDGGDIDNTVFG